MTTTDELRLLGVRTHDLGTASWTGAALALRCQLEAALDALAVHAETELHPALIDADVVTASRWLTSFPQLAVAGCDLDIAAAEAGRLQPHQARGLLAPAACHSVYHHHAGETIDDLVAVHVRGLVARNEDHVEPLRRQRVFTMDEQVAIGSSEAVEDFVATGLDRLDTQLQIWGIEVEWQPATDPFYRPMSGPALAQRVQTVKWEAIIGDLAIASANLHHQHFGEAFALSHLGEPAFSACLAVGLDRLVWAWLHVHGTDSTAWPAVRGLHPVFWENR